MANWKVVKAPIKLSCVGLGSCVGVVLYDSQTKIGGLAHVMLPENIKNDTKNDGKYADTAIKILLATMIQKGAKMKNIQAKIYGGAQMFSTIQSKVLGSIGSRNVKAVKNELRDHNIPLVRSDVGGTIGRTIVFDTVTGHVDVMTRDKSNSDRSNYAS